MEECAMELDDISEQMILDRPVITEESRMQQITAATILGISLILGIIGNMVFYTTPLGVNVPFFVLLFLAAAFWLLLFFRRSVVFKNALFAISAGLFAVLLCIRLTPELVLFNTALMLGSLFLVMRFASTSTFLGGHWRVPLIDAVLFGMAGWAEGPIMILLESSDWFKHVEFDKRHVSNVKSVLRGLLLTIPIVFLFAMLLASADTIFGDLLGDALSWMTPDNLPSLIAQIVIIGLITWGAMMAFKLLLFGPIEAIKESVAVERKKPGIFRLTMIETTMVLSSVNFLFLAFVIIQARYLFGGEANITAQGYTYAEYARRGFYELLAVSFMTMLLIVTFDALTYRKRENETFFRSMVTGLIVLTLVILVAAFRRLDLYENAYGFTRIRVMSGVFMFWLALLLGLLLVAILRGKQNLFWIGCLMTGIGFVVTLNIMNMDGFIASRNIARFEETDKLDVRYLLTLSDDAIPAVATLLDNNRLNDADHNYLLEGLGSRLFDLDYDKQSRGPLGYHIGKARAWKALDAHRDELRPYVQDNRLSMD
jgi:hypothetical protein